MAHLETHPNITLFYDTLVHGLGRPDVSYSDAHYLDGTLPDGLPFEVDDYNAFWLKDAPKNGIDQAGRRRLLAIGKSCLNVVFNAREPDSHTYIVGRPADVRPRFGLLEIMVDAGANAESQDLCNFQNDQLVPDPFTEPRLKAVYDYLTTA